ncbi:MAG: hypothetical protein LC747_05510 [Acidobacteria bacterium]|nr:hypothetical protein [Acidobacteriota bacterium]
MAKKKDMLNTRKIYSMFVALVFVVVTFAGVPAFAKGNSDKKSKLARHSVSAPLNLAILVQDDLVSRVGNELDATRDFVRHLPTGSRVMVGYLTSGSLQVRQEFTEDLEKAGRALRIPAGTETAAPYNPYVEVIEALRHFESEGKNRNAVLLISDGLDVSRGFDSFSSIHSVDMERAAREAKRRNVAVYSFYAPSVGLTSFSTRSRRPLTNFSRAARSSVLRDP